MKAQVADRVVVYTRQSPVRPAAPAHISIHPVKKAQQLLKTYVDVSNPEVRKITLHLLQTRGNGRRSTKGDVEDV